MPHRLLPWALACAFLSAAEPVTAEEAQRLGLVDRVVPREGLEEETARLASIIRNAS